MNELLTVLVPSLVGLLGVILGLLVGHHRWKAERQDTAASGYLQDRRAAYKELLERLESVHLELRAKTLSPQEFMSLVFHVNSHILKNAAFIDTEDRTTANEYLSSLYSLSELIRGSDDQRLAENWAISTVMPESVMRGFARLMEVHDHTERIRQGLIQKVKQVLS